MLESLKKFIYLLREENKEDADVLLEGLDLEEELKKESTSAQSIIFPKDKFTVERARKWLGAHGKHSGKVDSTENFHRFRQFDPSECSTTPKTISFGGSGIKAIICVKKSAEELMKMACDTLETDLETDLSKLDELLKSSAEINDLPDSSFAYIEQGGSKDEDGKTTPRSLRHFPIHDSNHVRNAMARVNQSPFGPKAKAKILAAAQRLGMHVDSEKWKKVAEDAPTAFEVDLKKYNLEKGLVYGIVYMPDEVDSQGDFTSSEEIERAAHEFLPQAAMNLHHTDKEANVTVVESYIAPCDLKFDSGELVKKGSWILVSKVNDADLLKSIETGEITGYSLEGTCMKLEI